ncbi:MAG TPA: serine/threonine-protein kinase [Gemmatimonadales bacterium]|nr:serine/threonine-protein kinase [Gemmatimonadales bacterium]
MTGIRSLAAALADRYRLERELGQGGMATVHLAHDIRHARPVAIKVLRPELAAIIGAERFLSEIRTTARLQHPHILPLFDSGEAAGQLFYVMPFIAGESLRDRLAREKQLPVADAVRIASEVAEALDYAHRQGIIHRDIKPANILLHEGSALVADFGIALAASRAGGTRMTETGMSLGTPEYMSPEQAMGEREITARSDVYALGAVTYEMLIGEPPFTGPTAQAIVARILTERPRSLGARRETIGPQIEAAVMTALQKLAADRFGSTTEFSNALRQPATAGPVARADAAPLSAGFRLSEEVCRRLPRASFDPRLIGTEQTYLDNGVSSDVLVCFIPAGQPESQYTEILARTRYRAIAPTLRGFEAVATWRPTLTLEAHLTLLRELLRDVVARAQPRFTVIAGFSSGGDLALRFAAAPDPEQRLQVDGCLSLGCNLARATCFVTGWLARLSRPDDEAFLAILREIASGATSLDEWINVCQYALQLVPTFRHDVGPLQAFASGIVAPFERADLLPFAEWYRAASEKGCSLRCVFEDTPMYRDLVRELQLRNLDDRLLGDRYREETLVTEAGTRHFDLVEPSRVERHVDALVRQMRRHAG